MKRIFKIFFIVLLLIFATLIAFFIYFFAGKAPIAENITWGIDFSQMQAEALGLDWKEAYSEAISDLGVKNIKLHTQWDWVEGQRAEYFFEDIDWQLQKAKENGVKVIYVVGMKTGRWPECHIPSWVGGLSLQEQKETLLDYLKKVVLRYKNHTEIIYWQVENEPLFKFGDCPEWYYKNDKFLKQEISLVRSLDSSRKIIVSDSGEQSLWFGAAMAGDIVGTTMYTRVWAHMTENFGFNLKSFLPPVSYWRKAQLVKKIFGKDVICVELQAEPWSSKTFYDVPLQEQLKTMNLDLFKQNIDYARNTGLDEFYLWGAEWWYWLKQKQGRPEIWNEARNLF